jgi:hypothetical protein
MEVLLFDHQDTRSIGIKMNWLGPSHLEVTYTHPAQIDFQAIKCAGIEISLRDLSGGRSETGVLDINKGR